MISSITKWFGTAKVVEMQGGLLKKQQELLSAQSMEIHNLRAEFAALKHSVPELISLTISETNAAVEAEKATTRDSTKNGSKPWVEIISDDYDTEKGLGLQLDWNDAFVKELRSKGFSGATDYAIVNSWLVALHKQMGESANDGSGL